MINVKWVVIKGKRSRFIAILIALISILVSNKVVAQQASANQYQVVIDSAAHQRFGLYYPVTYTFQIPPGSNNLIAQYRYNQTDNWINLPTRTSADFFNGINVARFDYPNNIAYLSVAFALSSDAIYLRVLNGQSEVPLVYLSIPQYYDNRHAAVAVTLDDWEGSNNSYFNAASVILTNAHVHYSVGIITSNTPDWALIQSWINTGYMEAAAHSRTHPCSASDYQINGYTYQIGGSKQDILSHLTLPFPYVPVYIEPCGYTDPQLRQAVVNAGYLAERGFNLPPILNTFSSWGADGAYQRALYSYDTDNWGYWDGTNPTALLAAVNSSFDTAYNAGGIYVLVDHPWQQHWYSSGSTLSQHINHIKDRLDVWYAAFGELYLYHFVQERGLVTINPMGDPPPTATSTPTSAPTPTSTATNIPQATNTPAPGGTFTPTPTNTPQPTGTPTPTRTATFTPTPTNTPLPSPTSTQSVISGASLWNKSAFPDLGTVNDPNAVELGVKFRSNVDGVIKGLLFYKGPSNTGTHIGHLWTNNGTLLASATFVGETSTGWQTVAFVTPVPITANTVYVASYHTDTGYFSMNQPYFNVGYSNGPLYAFGTNETSVGNGVYQYGPSAFPNQTYNASNYWVDIIFDSSTAPTPTPTRTPTATATNTPQPASTPTPTATFTSLPTNTPTSTATNTPQPTSTPTPTATFTPLPTNTPTSTATNTPQPTSTPTPTATFTPLPTNTPTSTATNTPQPSATPTSTATFTPLPTNTPTSTATDTPQPSATPTSTATFTPLPTNTPTSTATNTPQPSVTPTSTATFTPTATDTPQPSATPTPTATFTPLPTNTPTSTATNTPTPTSTPTPLPDLIFADGFESGNFSAWSSSLTNNGALSVSTAAAMVQTSGMRAGVNSNTSIYVTDNSPVNEARYRARFYFNPNSISMSNGNAQYLLYGLTGGGAVTLRVELGRSSTSYRIRANLNNNSTTWTNTPWTNISNAAHYIEIDWRAATAPGATDGGLTLWIDGVQRANLTGISNDARRIESVAFGAVAGIDNGTRGTEFFDAFESHRSTYIGP